MSADIEKQAVFDDRIVQSRPRYAVEKGALSVTNSPFNAIAANTSQHTYNILVPSENIFIDRAVDWTSTCYIQWDYVLTNTLTVPPATDATLGLPLPGFGQGSLALCAFPLQSLTTTMTATINDTTVTINSADVLPQVLKMTDMKKNRTVRTCPTQLDKYHNYSDASLSINSPLQGYNEAMNVDEVPNGAFASVAFTDPSGQPLFVRGSGATGASGAGNSQVVWAQSDGVPRIAWAGAGLTRVLPAGTTFRLYAAFTSTEKLVLSPFVFSDVHEWDTGLFGCQNIQLVMNLQQPGRVVRSAPVFGLGAVDIAAGGSLQIAPGSVVFNTGAGTGSFANSRVNLQFLTPSLDVPLPPKSIVPYMEFPRYISGNYPPVPTGATNYQITSQTITLPTIPDLLLIYVRPANNYSAALTTGGQTFTGKDTTICDFLLPIQGISVNFDNFAGLLSSHTQQQLYKMSVHNGLEMDWAQWSGVGRSSTGTQSSSALAAGQIPLVGGMLVLKPGRDIVLQAGQAPSLVGNFVLQFNLTVANYTGADIEPQVVVITANSGYFETIKGASRVVKGVLTEQDIISAPVAPQGTTGGLRRAVGGAMMGALGNAVHSLKGGIEMAKQGISGAMKKGLESSGSGEAGKVSRAMNAVGLGRSLKERLM